MPSEWIGPGAKIGDRTILYEAEISKNRDRQYACECKCGLITIIPRSHLTRRKRDRCNKCAGEKRYPPEREVGKKYGKWTVYKYIGSDKGGAQNYLVRCDCGSRQTVVSTALRLGITKQCKKCYLYKEMIGKKFNDWTVIKETSIRKVNKLIYYECVCVCGNKQNVCSAYLRNGKSNRCRTCANKENSHRRWNKKE